ncbi:AAA family ATPase [Cysteiniphilum sp. JM-1]|uniref:AAA family ATPase n=1 Tax=Cysteiniphilum sp. JM-1 TaxID=2610891 RepID=UPI001243D1EF|nr:AAA family ATPase [Cysteiniphilum sp. JM-1]
MGIFDSIHDSVEGIFSWINRLSKQDISNYCELESACDEHTLVSRCGTLSSLIAIDGYQRFISTSEYEDICQRLSDALQPLFSRDGHKLQVFFEYGNKPLAHALQQNIAPMQQSAQNIGLSIDDLMQAKTKMLESLCTHEACYFIISSSPSLLSKSQRNQALKEITHKLKTHKVNINSKSQQILLNSHMLLNTHLSTVQNLLAELKFIGFYSRLLAAHDALNIIRQSYAYHHTDHHWQAHLPGDPLPFKLPSDTHKNNHADYSDFLWAPLSEQMFPQDAHNIDSRSCQIGDTLFAPVAISLFPKNIRPFHDLLRKLQGSDLPWHISFKLSPNGMNLIKSKALLARFLAFSSHENKLILNAHKLLKTIDENSDDPVIQLSIIVTTWAPSHHSELLHERKARLYKIIQSWGSADVTDLFGDSFQTVISSCPAMTTKNYAATSAAPLSDAVKLLPLSRPASPWHRGNMLFRTPDGKLWPYQTGSKEQVSWVDLIFAKSGSGKSVLLNSLNLSACLSAGLSELPYIATIDIGPSSQGFISLLQNALPKEKQSQVVHHKFKMSEHDAINPFDTLFGARFPSHSHKAFIINFLCLLLSDDDGKLPQDISTMISMIIDATYHYFAQDDYAKQYISGQHPDIDSFISHHQDKDQLNTWWAVCDALYLQQEHALAKVAHCHAMPNLSDTIRFAHEPAIVDLYHKVQCGSENYLEYYCRMISSAIRNFPSLISSTKLDFSNARIVALDLAHVATAGSKHADKQTAIAYMLARHLIAQHFFIHEDEITSFPEIYRRYHALRLKTLTNEPKRLVFDEFHRTKGAQAIRDQVLRDMREGRKWKVQIALASQSLTDFDRLMLEFATSTFILDAGPEKTIQETIKTFGLNDTETLALKTRVHGPSANGATFIAQFSTKLGTSTQLLSTCFSALELWALSTTTEDSYIRDQLYKSLGARQARLILAEHFPEGSAQHFLSLQQKKYPEYSILRICDELISTLIQEYEKKFNIPLLFEHKGKRK